ncbi:MAG: type I-D CRISPR-associated helicase Cas3' [Truepera sp.]|nr:type I-D CRISPR-associated helicase Cas3' [Truepera sp.]
MIIRAHSVPTLASGLSPMQERLLRSEKFVRLVSAPTGSGKSYAFMRAVLNENASVLFIVPTKRLLQNLIDDAHEQAKELLRKEKRGWTEAQINAWAKERIVEWSGNQDKAGYQSLQVRRVRQVLEMGEGWGGGVIFAIPEVVVKMISGVHIKGASTINPFHYLRTFDHVVFDEFHTIDGRSFGLASLFSLLAVTERQGKVSLLSATPIDVTKILEQLGVDAEDVEQIVENVVAGHPSGHRPIHGDVTLELRECSLAESFALGIDDVRASIDRGRTVVVIFDSLARLKKEESIIRGALSEIGVWDDRVLAINSIDDSERKSGEPRRGRQYADPRKYDVLLCTSSVELGVTFQSDLMFIDPGHEIASFVQRVGRVARGKYNGRVIVSLLESRRNRDAWTRIIASVIENHEELDIEIFVEKILRDIRRCLEPTRKEVEADPMVGGSTISFFRKPSWRGANWAALFIVALQRKDHQKEANKRLRKISPNIVKFVGAKIREILSVDVVDDYLPRKSQPHKRWVTALLESALAYRDIGAMIEVYDPNGTSHMVTESQLRRATDILDRHIVSDEDEGRVVRLMSRTLDEEIRVFTEKPRVQMMALYVRSPIGDKGFELLIRERDKGKERLYRSLVEEWKHQFRRYIPARGDNSNDPRKKVMRAATALVERLGRPPLEEDYEGIGESAIFA